MKKICFSKYGHILLCVPFYPKFDVDLDLQKDHDLKMNHSKVIDRYIL